MERVVDSMAPSFFKQTIFSSFKQSLNENAGEISTMLHTDFVGNFCLFLLHAFRLDTHRRENVGNHCCCQQVTHKDPREPLLLTRMERGVQPALRRAA
jgi:hypothetical protein